LTSIAAIVIGVGLMAQGFNSAADNSRMTIAAGAAASPDLAGEVMVDVLAGITGVILGILALIGINVEILLASALIVFGGSLMLSGALTMQERVVIPAAGVGGAPLVANRGSAAGGMEVLLGIAAIVLGILALVLTNGGVLVMVGYIAVGAALLLVSASFTGAVIGIFTSRSTTTA
jgi:hypothetical protein